MYSVRRQGGSESSNLIVLPHADIAALSFVSYGVLITGTHLESRGWLTRRSARCYTLRPDALGDE